MWTGRLCRWGLAAAVAAVALAAAGCASDGGSPGAMRAEPVSGWDDVRSVSRSGRFTFAGQPNEAALERFAAEGGAMVIDTRTHEGSDGPEFDEQGIVTSLGMQYVHLPVSPETFSAADVERFAELAQQTEGPVLLHCSSSNRVGALWAAYLAREKGVATEKAIAAGKTAGLRTPEAEEAARRVIGP
ncbi:MAG: beta-lactamase hydrolase domain-containing protein [Phycisphaerales bacterium JB039]